MTVWKGVGSNVPHTRGDEPNEVNKRKVADLMFPTHVGMNRLSCVKDEPKMNMFPTHVGMNRIARHLLADGAHVPHTRGDEPPLTKPSKSKPLCSPHTWG